MDIGSSVNDEVNHKVAHSKLNDLGRLAIGYVAINILAAGLRIGSYYIQKDIYGKETAKAHSAWIVDKAGDDNMIGMMYKVVLPGNYFVSKLLSK